ncbi:hypothetical protein E8E13_002209 [Curvularia kusanoi]|uniref:Uncharacterized protein n=1 Tax=Curvularia kusanoi TaxID=90978 RepID=A0A9P4W3C8_CURKU|nr:hypothetical protein E8E13_002209 [Curvularia kusanoi]
MAPPPDGTAAVQHSRLLAIPGEIHNLIYEFIIEKALSRTQLKFTDVKEHPDSIRLTRKPGHEQDWPNLLRISVGLTQTCRQLRQEFLPIHQACVTVRVTKKDLPEYTATFIDGLDVANLNVWLPAPR